MKKFLNIKSFQETLNSGMCGPASLKIILSYYGIEEDEGKLAKLCFTDKNLGTNDISLKKTAESFGFKVTIKNNSTFKDIEEWLNKGVPVIVNWFTRGRSDYTDEDVPDGHYSVVYGLDNKYIYLQDPEIGKSRRIEKEIFMSVWFDFTGEYITKENLIICQCIAIYK